MKHLRLLLMAALIGANTPVRSVRTERRHNSNRPPKDTAAHRRQGKAETPTD